MIHYNVMNEIGQSNAGISIGKLHRGDGKDPVVKAKILFPEKEFKSVVAPMEEVKEKRRPSPTTENVEETTESRKVKFGEVEVFGTLTETLFDLDAIPDVISIALSTKLHVHPRPKKRRITMVGNQEAVVVGEVHGVPVTAAPVTTEQSCLIIRSSTLELIFGRPKVK